MKQVSRYKSLFSKTLLLCVVIAGLLLSRGVIRTAGRKSARRALGGTHALPRTTGKLAKLPRTILWAWERPEKLDFIDPNTTGVAFLAKTLDLRGNAVVARPRLQPLTLPQGLPVVAVVRLESNRSQSPALSPSLSHEQMESAAAEIVELARLPNVVAVQIDFDAKVSERSFYSQLLTQVRGALPPATALSMTALASWCQGDTWLEGLPVDEAVPMLFRMGVDRTQIVSNLASGEGFRSPLCRQSAGVATDEALPDAPPSERLYVFNPNSWSPSSVKNVLEKYQR